MEDQLISFETAKLAKEKGFNEECRFYYDMEHKELTFHVEMESFRNSEITEGYGKLKFEMISAPTQSLLQRWLREKKEIHIESRTVKLNVPEVRDKVNHWYIKITSLDGELLMSWALGFDDYESAIEFGLQEALKLILKKEE